MADTKTGTVESLLTLSQAGDLKRLTQELAEQSEQWVREYRAQQLQAQINARKIKLH